MKKWLITVLTVGFLFVLIGCQADTTAMPTTSPTTTPPSTQTPTSTNATFPVWDTQSIRYEALHIRSFGSGTPAGTVHYDSVNDQAVIWNIDASLDNYGGVQTPMMALDFSQAVIFQMEVVDVYMQYIVKLAVQGESEYYYVLSDEPTTGLVSINVVDAMLSEKYRTRNTQPDPGYQSGWKYAGQTKNCSFHILAKGPDGEKQTAELVIKSISIFNNMAPLEEISITAPGVEGNVLTQMKQAPSIQLGTAFTPQEGFDDTVLWSSDDPQIARVDEEGNLCFVGVGITEIHATALIDQSKRASMTINVLSGFEQPAHLRSELEKLRFDGTASDRDRFNDLFQTTWGEDIHLQFSLPAHPLLSVRFQEQSMKIDNHFDVDSASNRAIADQDLDGTKAFLEIPLAETATIYRLSDGVLVSESLDSIKIAYADYDADYTKRQANQERIMVVYPSGVIKKLEIHQQPVRVIKDDQAADFLDDTLWIVPDRTKQALDPVAHQLSPALISLEVDGIKIKQNKYPEAKYCFGGIISSMISIDDISPVELQIDVARTNAYNEFVQTMWEVKIIYYHMDGSTVVSSTPLKLTSSQDSGFYSFVFTPAYRHFRLYLVANGSDIGQQFPDAEIVVSSLKLLLLEAGA